ncbi:MAG: hypothetical protein GY790_15540 [Bacteroidetes bacterium]|nr:hypothetical protein [Bacteroidota bacterium]
MTQSSKVCLILACLFVSGTVLSKAQLPTKNDPGNQIRFQKRWEAEKRRDTLIRFFWDDGLPTGILPDVTPDVTGQALSTHLKLIDEKLVARVDQLEVESLGLTSLIYLIHPVKKADGPELVIVQAGHSPSGTDLNTSYQSTIDLFLASGYSVMMVHMPMHDRNMDTSLEPIIASINYWEYLNGGDPQVSMIGVSGGGWITHMAAALDTRIKLSIPVAGSCPLHLRNSSGNSEEITEDGTGGGIATWLEIYALGAIGNERKQIMVTAQDDNKSIVSDAVTKTSSGEWKHMLDTTHHKHQISPWVVENVIQATLSSYPMNNVVFSEWKQHAQPLELSEWILYHSERMLLSETMAHEAGKLLSSDDLFVQAAAEWALSLKVGNENMPDVAKWPGENNPEWFNAWQKIPLEKRVEMDWCRQALAAGLSHDPAALTAQIEEMGQRVGRQLKNGAFRPETENLANSVAQELDELAGRAKSFHKPESKNREVRDCWLDARRLLRPLVFSNKDIDFDSLVLYTRFAPHHKSNVCGNLHNAIYKPGGDITILQGMEKVREVRSVIGDKLERGHVHGMDLHFDGEKVVFAYGEQLVWPPKKEAHFPQPHNSNWALHLRQSLEPVSLYEINLDGSDLKRLTSHPLWSDTYPVYCPNDDVAFSSERSSHSPSCDSENNDIADVNLYLYRRNSSTIRRLTNHRDVDMTPRLLDNGLLAYLRWEYQERYFTDTHSIWSVRPDGTNADALFKQHIPSPWALREARSIPNSGKLVAIAAGHHCYSRGPIIVVNPGKGGNNQEMMENMTPGVLPQEGELNELTRAVTFGGVQESRGYYRNPYPLSETVMLASYSYASPYCVRHTVSEMPGGAVEANGYGIYLIDSYGNKELIYRDPLYCSVDVAPLKKRIRPTVLPDMVSQEKNYATCIIPDIYEGMAREITPGSIKYIRISQHLPTPIDENGRARKFAFGDKWGNIPSVTRWTSVREIGVVPVEADGSAHFKVPTAGAASVYFQALDENYMEVVRMRSSVSFQPGEVRSCTGCHETQNSRAPAQSYGFANSRPPVMPLNSFKGYAPFDYETMVQPILDRNCIECHSAGNEKTALDFTDKKNTVGIQREFNQSYITILGPDLLGTGEESLVALNDRMSDGSVTKPRQFGSSQSQLTQTLLKGHYDVQLSKEDWYTLVTWVDYNAPYHGRLINKYPADGSNARREAYSWPDPWQNQIHEVPAYSGQSVLPEPSVDRTLIVADPEQGKIFRYDKSGRITWSCDAGVCYDMQLLESGNILFTDGREVKELNRKGEVIYAYDNGGETYSCQRLPDGNTLVSDCSGSRLLVLNRSLKPEKSIELQVENRGHHGLRWVRRGPEGTYFVAQEADHMVCEYDQEGRLLRRIEFPDDVFSVVPVNNGNVIMGGVGGIRIVDPEDQVVWSLKPGDIPEVDLQFVLGIELLPNGNLLVANWIKKPGEKRGIKLFEVDRDRKLVRTFPWTEELERPSCMALSGLNYDMASTGEYLVSDPLQKKISTFSESGELRQEYAVSSCIDLQWLDHGNLLYVDGKIVKEIRPDGKLIGKYVHRYPLSSCHRMENGQTVLLDAAANNLLFLDAGFRKINTLPLATRKTAPTSGLVRQTGNGTFLVALGDDHLVREYDINAEVIRVIDTRVAVTALTTNFAGDVIVGSSEGIRIVAPDNQLIWSLTREEVPEVNLQQISSLEVRDNGNLVVANHIGQSGQGIALFEITPKKKIVRTFKGAETASILSILN